MERIIEILRKVGLTSQESKVYIILLKLQESQTGQLCKEANIASSNIYKILDSLIKKGLVSYRVQNNIKIFMASPPETLNELFFEKQKKLEEERSEIKNVIENLKKEKLLKEPFSKYKYFEGLPGIKSMWYEVNSIMNKNMLLKIHTAKKESYENLVGFYNLHHNLRIQKKVNEQMIFPKEEKELYKIRSDKYTKIRFLDLKQDVEWGIIGDMMFFQYVTGKVPRGFLIKDEKFASAFEEVFDRLWKLAKS